MIDLRALRQLRATLGEGPFGTAVREAVDEASAANLNQLLDSLDVDSDTT
jgi:hypothetical protein